MTISEFVETQHLVFCVLDRQIHQGQIKENHIVGAWGYEFLDGDIFQILYFSIHDFIHPENLGCRPFHIRWDGKDAVLWNIVLRETKFFCKDDGFFRRILSDQLILS